MRDVVHPDFQKLGESYQICECGQHILSKKTKNLLKLFKTPQGYHTVSVCVAEKEMKNIFVHQLVAHTYLRCPSDGQTYVVDHKNHVRTDNRSENLRFVTYSENNKNASGSRKSKPILQLTMHGELIKEYSGISEVTEQNPNWSSAGICICLRSDDLMKASSYGYRWKYKFDKDRNIKYVLKEEEVFKDINYFNTFTKKWEVLTFPNYEVSNFGNVKNKIPCRIQ